MPLLPNNQVDYPLNSHLEFSGIAGPLLRFAGCLSLIRQVGTPLSLKSPCCSVTASSCSAFSVAYNPPRHPPPSRPPLNNTQTLCGRSSCDLSKQLTPTAKTLGSTRWQRLEPESRDLRGRRWLRKVSAAHHLNGEVVRGYLGDVGEVRADPTPNSSP